MLILGIGKVERRWHAGAPGRAELRPPRFRERLPHGRARA